MSEIRDESADRFGASGQA